MNREQTKETIRVMDASINGMEVESKLIGTYDWVLDKNPSWNWLNYDYRIKPTAKFRPWTADEVPLGAWMRDVSKQDYRWLIHTSGNADTRKDWLVGYKHSTDGGKTWHPCGVMEETE
jgi:hypothetical protein